MGEVVGRGMQASGAMLMGRRLYDEWSAYWPEHADDDFGGVINGAQKYVVSSSLTRADWQNTELVTGDDAAIAARLRAVRDATDGELTLSGSATLVRWLIGQGLLDRLELLVHPIAVGHGRRLFEESGTVPLSLESCATLANGVLHLTYRPAEAPAAG